MAIVEVPPTGAAPSVEIDRPVDRPPGAGLTIEHCAYLALLALALIVHLYALGDGALHHDETHHANFAWRLYQGLGFFHDPLLHGPFLYHINALFFWLFGDNNTTARLGPALFGSALVVMPYLIRRELGRGAALLAAVYLLVSPAYLYWGRHIRHDMYGVTFELLAFIGIVRYTGTRRPLWLYVAAAALALMFTNMETFFLYAVIFGSLIALVFLWRVWRPGIAVAAALGLAIIAAVFILPGKPIASGGGDVQRVSGSYVCPSAGEPFPPDNPIQADPGPIFGFQPLPTADNNYALCVKNQLDDNFGLYFIKLGQFFGHPAILLGMGVTVAGLAALYLLIWRRRDSTGATTWQRARMRSDELLEAFASLGGDWRLLTAFAIFFTLYALFFTAFLTHPTGVISGTTGSLLYWLAQHGVARGSQPQYYYLILLVLYEPLVVIWGTVGLLMVGFMGGRRLMSGWKNRAPEATEHRTTNNEQRAKYEETTGDGRRTTDDGQNTQPPGGYPTRSTQHAIDWPFALPIVLAWWAVATLGLYSWAGEKMPWLTIHVALPWVLLGAWALARMLAAWRTADLDRRLMLSFAAPPDSAEPSERNGNGRGVYAAPSAPHASAFGIGGLPTYLLIFGAIGMACLIRLANLSQPDEPQQWRIAYVLLSVLGLVGLLTAGAALLRGPRWAIGALAIGLTLAAGCYTLTSAYRLSFLWPDSAREKMIFVQTSPDVARVIDRLEKASMRRGGGLDMPVWYDNETVWAWYLRRFTNKQQQPPALSTVPGPEIQAVLMLQENIDAHPQNRQNLQGFRIQRYPLRWWFPNEGNRLPDDWRTAPLEDSSPLLMRLLRNPLDGRSQAQLWRYLIYRVPPEPLGSTDFVIAVRPELANEIGLGTGGGQDQ